VASTNKVFISFALKDTELRDQLIDEIGQINEQWECIYMPQKKSWESAWKAECQETVRGCDGAIGIITANTIRADGQQWELHCAYESQMRVLLIGDDEACEMPAKKLPDLLKDEDIHPWDISTIKMFLNRL
jgi:hypothetical protein